MKKNFKPKDTLDSFVNALNQRDLKAVMNSYESKATLFIANGKIAYGEKEIKRVFEKLMTQKPMVKTETASFVEKFNIVAYCTKWELKNYSDEKYKHQTFISVDILRKQKDGSWLISIHSPWGIEFLNKAL